MDITVNSQWTKDCCGKQDLDFSIIDANTRYWPNKTAKCEIVFLNNFCLEAPSGEEYVDSDFEPVTLLESDYIQGETEEEVKRKVKEWYNNNVIEAMEKALKIIREK